MTSQLGTIPVTLSRSLARLSKEIAIEVRGSEIVVLDLNKLKEINVDYAQGYGISKPRPIESM